MKRADGVGNEIRQLMATERRRLRQLMERTKKVRREKMCDILQNRHVVLRGACCI